MGTRSRCRPWGVTHQERGRVAARGRSRVKQRASAFYRWSKAEGKVGRGSEERGEGQTWGGGRRHSSFFGS